MPFLRSLARCARILERPFHAYWFLACRCTMQSDSSTLTMSYMRLRSTPRLWAVRSMLITSCWPWLYSAKKFSHSSPRLLSLRLYVFLPVVPASPLPPSCCEPPRDVGVGSAEGGAVAG